QGGGKRRGLGLSIIALSLTRDCKPRKAKGATQTREEREPPAGVRAKRGSPAHGRRVQSPAASLKPGRVNRAFRRQARISTDRKKPRPDRRWSGLQEGKPVQSTPTAQIGNSPYYPRRWSSGSLALLAAMRWAASLLSTAERSSSSHARRTLIEAESERHGDFCFPSVAPA